jgi:hypothetical protein
MRACDLVCGDRLDFHKAAEAKSFSFDLLDRCIKSESTQEGRLLADMRVARVLFILDRLQSAANCETA